MTKKNLFSKDLNDNIGLLITFKKYKEKFRELKLKEKNIIEFNNAKFEKEEIKDDLDPSFLIYQTKYISNKIKEQIEIEPSLSSLINIWFYENTKYERAKLVLLPTDKHKYKDSLYILKNLSNFNTSCLNKEIDALFCIIDDNEY